METKPNQELHFDSTEENEERIFTITQDEDDNFISILVDDGADRKLSVYSLDEDSGE